MALGAGFGTRVAGDVVLRDVLRSDSISVTYRGSVAGQPGILRVLNPEAAQDPELIREWEAAAGRPTAVDHVSLLAVHDVAVFDERPTVVHEFVDWPDLASHVRLLGPLDPAAAARVIAAIADALAVMHSLGVSHGHVEPQEILVSPDGSAKLAGFGFARPQVVPSEIGGVGRYRGSLEFSAPEQILTGRADSAADVYALAGVLYFALTAEYPFDRPLDALILRAHMLEKPLPPSRLREGALELDAVVVAGLEKRVELRPSAAQFAQRLRADAGITRPQTAATQAGATMTLPLPLLSKPQAGGSPAPSHRGHRSVRLLVAFALIILLVASAGTAWGYTTWTDLESTRASLQSRDTELAAAGLELQRTNASLSRTSQDLSSARVDITSTRAELAKEQTRRGEFERRVGALEAQVGAQTQCIIALGRDRDELNRIAGLMSANFSRTARGSAFNVAADARDLALRNAAKSYYDAYSAAYDGYFSLASSYVTAGNAYLRTASDALTTMNAQVGRINAATGEIDSALAAFSARLGATNSTCHF